MIPCQDVRKQEDECLLVINDTEWTTTMPKNKNETRRLAVKRFDFDLGDGFFEKNHLESASFFAISSSH